MYCAIDFGTSNSGIAVPAANMPGGAVQLLEIEPGHPTMPTAVFYAVEGLAPREVPSRVYFDLATWHLINTVYIPHRVAELARMRDFYGDARQHERLMRVVTQRLGHALAALAEQGKIDVADGGQAHLALDAIESGLAVMLTQARAIDAIGADLERVVDAASDTLRQAGVGPDAVDALYLTGGSTGLTPLAQRLAAVCPAARMVRGDRFASVAQGLGLHAQRLFAPTPRA